MKKIIEFFVSLLISSLLTIGVLKIWDIDIISNQNVSKIGLTIGLLLIGSTVLTLLIAFFFKNNQKNFDSTKGKVAHPRE